MGKVNEYLSKKIAFISMVSMLAVVFAHAYNYTDNFLKPDTIITEGLHPGACIQFAIANALARFSVPFFFMISGFLFFYGKNFNFSTYLSQIKKRCKSVLSVFLIFSVISFVVCNIIYKITGAGLIPMIDERMGEGIYGWVYPLLQNPFAFQLWFLAQLFIMSLVSPAVYFLVKKLKWIPLIFLAVFWFANENLTRWNYTFFNCDAYMFFTLGAYIAVNNVKIKGLCEKTNNKCRWIVSVVLWISVAAVYTIVCATAEHSSYLQTFLFKLSILCGIAAIWYSYDRASEKLLNNSFVKKLSKNNFTVYLLHEPALHIIYMVTLACFSSELSHTLLFYLLPVLIILACVYVGEFLRRKCPRLNNILTGGR